MIDRSPSPRGGAWIVDPPGVQFAGAGWPATDAHPVAAVPCLARIVVGEMRARDAATARSAADAVAGVR